MKEDSNKTNRDAAAIPNPALTYWKPIFKSR